MKLPLLVAVSLASSLSLMSAQIVLIEEDFEAGGGALTTGNAGASRTDITDPAAGGTNGTVAAVDLSGGNQWGAFNAVPNANLALPAASVPGSDMVTARFDVYIDSANTTFLAGEAEDRVNMILRFNSGVDNADREGRSSNNAWEAIPHDQWHTVQWEGVIPEMDKVGLTITHVMPIISFRDQDDNAAAGIAVYFDNFELTATIPNDDPNLGAVPVAFGDLIQGDGPHTP